MRRSWSDASASSARWRGRWSALPAVRPRSWSWQGEPGIGKTRLLGELSARGRAARLPGARRARDGVRARRALRPVGRRRRPVSAVAGRRAAAAAGRRRARGARRRAARVRRRCSARRRRRPSATSCIARCAACSSGSRRRARWCCASTTCTGPIRPRSTCWRRWRAARPSGAVLLAVAYREGQAPDALVAALGDAGRAARSERLAPAPLSRGRGGRPLRRRGRCRSSTSSAAATRSISSSSRERGPTRVPPRRSGRVAPGFPPPSRPRWRASSTRCPSAARRVLDAAAVAGEPFEPDLVADVADLGEDVTLAALDALLERALIRPTAAPRRFAFRHPLIRHAVYAAAPGAWRLRAHAPRGGRARAARRGAGRARPPRRARRPARRSRRRRPAGRRRRARVRAGARERRALPRERPAAAPGRRRPDARPDRAAADARLRAVRRGPARGGAPGARRDAGAAPARRMGAARAADLLPDRRSRPGRDARSQSRCAACAPRSPRSRGGPSLAGFTLRMSLAGLELYDLRLDRVPRIATEALAHARGIGDRRLEHAALAMIALGARRRRPRRRGARPARPRRSRCSPTPTTARSAARPGLLRSRLGAGPASAATRRPSASCDARSRSTIAAATATSSPCCWPPSCSR